MKRYWLFEQQQYYPSGGMLDFLGDFDTVEEAKKARSTTFNPIEAEIKVKKVRANEIPADMKLYDQIDTGYHILDIHEMIIVEGWDQYSKIAILQTPLNKFN